MTPIVVTTDPTQPVAIVLENRPTDPDYTTVTGVTVHCQPPPPLPGLPLPPIFSFAATWNATSSTAATVTFPVSALQIGGVTGMYGLRMYFAISAAPTRPSDEPDWLEVTSEFPQR